MHGVSVADDIVPHALKPPCRKYPGSTIPSNRMNQSPCDRLKWRVKAMSLEGRFVSQVPTMVRVSEMTCFSIRLHPLDLQRLSHNRVPAWSGAMTVNISDNRFDNHEHSFR